MMRHVSNNSNIYVYMYRGWRMKGVHLFECMRNFIVRVRAAEKTKTSQWRPVPANTFPFFQHHSFSNIIPLVRCLAHLLIMIRLPRQKCKVLMISLATHGIAMNPKNIFEHLGIRNARQGYRIIRQTSSRTRNHSDLIETCGRKFKVIGAQMRETDQILLDNDLQLEGKRLTREATRCRNRSWCGRAYDA